MRQWPLKTSPSPSPFKDEATPMRSLFYPELFLRQNRFAFLVEALLNSIGQAKSCLLSDKGVAPPGLPPFAQLIEIEISA